MKQKDKHRRISPAFAPLVLSAMTWFAVILLIVFVSMSLLIDFPLWALLFVYVIGIACLLFLAVSARARGHVDPPEEMAISAALGYAFDELRYQSLTPLSRACAAAATGKDGDAGWASAEDTSASVHSTVGYDGSVPVESLFSSSSFPFGLPRKALSALAPTVADIEEKLLERLDRDKAVASCSCYPISVFRIVPRPPIPNYPAFELSAAAGYDALEDFSSGEKAFLSGDNRTAFILFDMQPDMKDYADYSVAGLLAMVVPDFHRFRQAVMIDVTATEAENVIPFLFSRMDMGDELLYMPDDGGLFTPYASAGLVPVVSPSEFKCSRERDYKGRVRCRFEWNGSLPEVLEGAFVNAYAYKASGVFKQCLGVLDATGRPKMSKFPAEYGATLGREMYEYVEGPSSYYIELIGGTISVSPEADTARTAEARDKHRQARDIAWIWMAAAAEHGLEPRFIMDGSAVDGELDDKGWKTFDKMKNTARDWGVDAMLEAYYSGVPVADIVAGSDVPSLPNYI